MEHVAELSVKVEPLDPEVSIMEVGDLFLEPRYDGFLSLPVVRDSQPIGVISRYGVQKVLMGRYGRELQGAKPVVAFMNDAPLVVPLEHSVEQASRHITRNIRFPIVEDFIVTREGEYHGVGSVIDLLRGLEDRLMARNDSLAQSLNRLQESQAQLVQSEKMASLGQMVAGLAHEINTPLGYVRNNVELARSAFGQLSEMQAVFDSLVVLLQSPQADDAALQQAFTRAMAVREQAAAGFAPEDMEALFADTMYGLEQISDLVINLRNFSRLDRSAVVNVDINQCVESTLLIAHNLLKHKVEVIRDLGELPPVTCAPSQINQVLLNLVSNAAQAIEDRGRIRISTVCHGGFVHVLVKDDGKGIRAENLERIFDPFFTTKPVGEGTGLGLSISYKIVRDHGGHIRVKSQPGKGTAFCVSLPVTSGT